jgi:CubicO group peptidase (beta-lactamase class C family)
VTDRRAAASDRLDLDGTRLDRAFQVVEQQVLSGRARYASLGVGRGDGLVRTAAYGPDGTFTAGARFLVASITKPITATAVLQLVEDGRLALSAPVRDHLPAFAPIPAEPGTPGAEAITAWHILTHTSGLTDAGEEYLELHRPTQLELLTRIRSQRLEFVPGSRFGYASDSFYLLAELVERLGGRPFADHLRGRILGPLGMASTTFDPSETGPRGLPLGGTFDRYGALLDEATSYFVSLAMPAGGLWSTADDLVRFGRAMLLGGTLDGARILGRPFVELMTREHTAGIMEPGDPPRRPAYGLGWHLPGLDPGSPASRMAFGHRGATGTALVVDPGYDLVVVYLRNEWGSTDVTADEAIQAVYGALA